MLMPGKVRGWPGIRDDSAFRKAVTLTLVKLIDFGSTTSYQEEGSGLIFR